MDQDIKRAEQKLADAVRRRVKLGGHDAEVAASIAREFAYNFYDAGNDSPSRGFSRVSFYVAAGLTAAGELA